MENGGPNFGFSDMRSWICAAILSVSLEAKDSISESRADVKSRADKGPSSIPSSRRAAGGTRSAVRQRILSLAELMARANHIAASRYRIGESAVVLVTTPLL